MSEIRQNRYADLNITPVFPKNMLIEITNICNQNCVFCGYSKQLRKGMLSDKNFMFNIMYQAYKLGTKEIGFYMIGEPFINIELEDYIKKSKEIGFEYIYLTTNGALANIDRIKKLVKAGLDSIKFSVNSATRENYKKIHGKDDFDVVKKNITDIYEYKKTDMEFNIKTFISYIINNINKNEIQLFKQIFEKYVDKIYFFNCNNQGGGMSPDLLNNGIVDDILPGSKAPCDMVFNRIHITCEGYLDVCCTDTDNALAVADLHNMSLEDAWNSDTFKELRKQHLEGKLLNNMCHKCIYNSDIDIVPLNKDLYCK